MPSRTAPPGGACGCAASPQSCVTLHAAVPRSHCNKQEFTGACLPRIVPLPPGENTAFPQNQSRERLRFLMFPEGGDPTEPLGDITQPQGTVQSCPVFPVLWAPARPGSSTIPLAQPGCPGTSQGLSSSWEGGAGWGLQCQLGGSDGGVGPGTGWKHQDNLQGLWECLGASWALLRDSVQLRGARCRLGASHPGWSPRTARGAWCWCWQGLGLAAAGVGVLHCLGGSSG